jgi:DNA (cytosine-5)-methyltransferase 1
MTTPPLKKGPWKLTDLAEISKTSGSVFSCFHCGGGSTMGYKLAGFDVLGGVEIDPQMMAIYRANHKPKYSYLMGVQEFYNITDNEIPPVLFNLDILDGSPPCSSFSMAGSREKKWGKASKFREGQAHQVLDDLFFDFIAIAKKLQPKVVIAENVKGLIQGNARGYVKEIFAAFREAGYSCQLFLLNAAAMGVPQRRERTFFIANRIGKKINLEFNEKQIPVSVAFNGLGPGVSKLATEDQAKWWGLTAPGEPFSKSHPTGSWFNSYKLHPGEPAKTLTASGGAGGLYHWSEARKITDSEALRVQTFPDDYNLLNQHGQYICGMSVPPFMMQRVADQVYKQILRPNK